MYDSFLGPLNHIGVAVPDIDKAIDMYRTVFGVTDITCLLYTSPSPRDATLSRMPSSA